MKQDTKLVALGRAPVRAQGPVNLPVHRGVDESSPSISTAMSTGSTATTATTNVTYGATGTQNSRALAEAVAAVEGGVSHRGDRQRTLGSDDGGLCRGRRRRPRARFPTRCTGRPDGSAPKSLSPLRSRIELLRPPGVGGGVWRMSMRANTRLVYTEAPRLAHVRDAGRARRRRSAAHERGGTGRDGQYMGDTRSTSVPWSTASTSRSRPARSTSPGHSDLVIGMITTAD